MEKQGKSTVLAMEAALRGTHKAKAVPYLRARRLDVKCGHCSSAQRVVDVKAESVLRSLCRSAGRLVALDRSRYFQKCWHPLRG